VRLTPTLTLVGCIIAYRPAVCSLTPPAGWTITRAGDFDEADAVVGVKRSPASWMDPFGIEMADILLGNFFSRLADVNGIAVNVKARCF
jgi:hypothetical protein